MEIGIGPPDLLPLTASAGSLWLAVGWVGGRSTRCANRAQNEVLVEAGHRCAIPACRATTTEIAHILPWSEAREHAFENLIALCPNCHTRYDKGEIDRQSMGVYKRNLGLIGDRYSDAERRLLELFAQNPDLRWAEFDHDRGFDQDVPVGVEFR